MSKNRTGFLTNIRFEARQGCGHYTIEAFILRADQIGVPVTVEQWDTSAGREVMFARLA